jgi:SMC interacting uncharacterized protein involved in chromosome segregation
LRRIERKLLKINDEIAALTRDEHRVAQELGMLRHLDDDAQRDAAVGGPLERDLARLGAQREALEQKRQRLLARLD